MKKMKLSGKKILCFTLALTIFGGALPDEFFSGLSKIFTPLFVNAVDEDEIIIHKETPECEFIDELYDGSDAISPLPKTAEYKEGYSAPKNISLTDFQEKFGKGAEFDIVGAKAYIETEGYKIMLSDAEELYNYSRIVNERDDTSEGECELYLSANIILGNNIEYSEMSENGKYFLPIGSDRKPFTGTFDGQNFEIRDIYLDKTYSYVTIGFFGVIGEGAEVKNFGIYHPTIYTVIPASYTAVIASRNNGIITDVYVIANEYKHETSVNMVTSANANCAAGLVAQNNEKGIIQNSYFAGMLNASEPHKQHPVCAENKGTITNCYYDKDIFQYGTSGTQIDNHDNENMKPLSNIDLKRVGFSENGMKNTKFKVQRLSTISNTSTAAQYWGYPRLYGFTGTGTEDDPFVISTPADLIYFPCSYEYQYNYNKKQTYLYFALGNCIDMNEVSPNAYQPKLDNYFETNSTNGTLYTYTRKNSVFCNVFLGTAHNDEDCTLKHISQGKGIDGNDLQECHIIYNLTIDTPATTVSDKSAYYTAFIAYAGGNKGYYTNPKIKDVQFVGGEISSGDTDCMPTTNNPSSYNVKTATVVARAATGEGSASGIDMDNVHSSATVKLGTGEQYSSAIGGLTAWGALHFITDCTNSGDVIGGYIDAPENSGIVAENFKIGGVFGAAGATTNTQWGWTTVIENVANYGNVYGIVIVDDKDSEKVLTSGKVSVAGISTGNIASWVSKTIEEPDEDSVIEFNDTNRSQKIANFGMIFDGPVELDENGDPVFDENGKPKALPLDEDKKILVNSSAVFITDIYGIGNNIICNAYNNGNIYSIMVEKCRIAGIGNMTTGASGTNYYNYMNYNAGNIYMYAGSLGASGISNAYAYKCYNSGDIFVYDGEIVNYSSTSGVRDYGNFSGIAIYTAGGCYNAGDIYIAPTARKAYNSTSVQNYVTLVSGISSRWAEELTENEKIIKSINAGNIILDLDKNKFDPTLYTNDITNNSYYPFFYMEGTGLGSGNENYGKILFIENSDDTSKMVKLRIAGCGGTVDGISARNCNDCINYADISVNVPNGLYSLLLTGVNNIRSSTNDTYTANNNINFGNITFSGKATSNVVISCVWWSSAGGKSENCINFGNVTVKEGSYIGETLYVSNCLANATNKDWAGTVSTIMNGWYDGCNIPTSLNTKTNQEIFGSLDKTKRYGVFKISGYAKSANVRSIHISNISFAVIENIINNGEIEITDASFENLYLYGITNNKASNSQNYAPININNVLFKGNAFIAGAAGGESNINYADITVENCVTQAPNANYLLFVSGVSYNVNGSNLENRGNLTVDNLYSATYNGVEYYSPQKYNIKNLYDANLYVSGIFNNSSNQTVSVSNCINFGDIYVNKAIIGYLGGINGSSANYKITASRCVNYGDIELKNSGGEIAVGGIFSRYGPADNCANFGDINVENLTSYQIKTPSAHIGGIGGWSNKGISCCANYGNITYKNTNGLNPDNIKDNTNKSFKLYIGGVVGIEESSASYVMNYGNVTEFGEQNLSTYIGGIIGSTKVLSSNMINYGNITFSRGAAQENENNISGCYVGGILGKADANTDLQYGINYGSITQTDDIEVKTYVGSILGGTGNNKFVIDKFVDLSNVPDGSESYSLIGSVYNNNCSNTSSEANYTLHEDVIEKTDNKCGGRFGTVKQITLDKNDETGLYSANFVFRSNLMHELSEYVTNLNNGLMYQDIDKLSPYLQSYMKERFGDDICGAYVLVKGNRSPDEFFPDGLRSEYIMGGYTNYRFEFGCTDNVEDSSLIEQEFPNDIYSDYANENYDSLRTIKSDMEYYAQQVVPSSMAEIYGFGLNTKYAYGNTDTSDYQYFEEYKCYIETNPAVMEDNSISDTLLYTDINIYVAIDDIDSSKARMPVLDEDGEPVYDDEGNPLFEDIDTDNNIYFNPVIDLSSYYSSIKFYTGDIMDITERGNEALYNHYTDPYPDDFWLTNDDLSEQIEDTALWSKSYFVNGLYGGQEIKTAWNIAIPFNDINTDTKNMYTKVLGVMTAEDGIHKNVIVVHVIIDLYKPYAELDSVQLDTPDNGKVTSTVDNGGMTSEENNYSLTDNITDDEGNEVPKQDVYYYYMSDDITSDGSNIQKYQTGSGDVIFTVTTHNMSTEDSLWAEISWQDRIPSLSGLDYNAWESVLWNDKANGRNSTEFSVNPTDVVYDEQNKSIGTATFKFSNSKVTSDQSYGGIYYGGLYRVDLYYERTKNSGIKKHFATVFFWKEHSPENKNVRLGNNISNWEETEDDTVLQYAYASDGAGNYSYSSANINARYVSRETNETSNGWNYSSKAYISSNPAQDYYIDVDNPIYNSLEEDEPKGYNPNLESTIESVDVYVDEETGAFYPANFHIDMQIMAENTQIRHMYYERVHYGIYGKDDTLMYDSPPVISLSSVTQDGYNIVANEDGIYKAVVDGDEEQDPTFVLNWTNVGSRVSLFHSSNLPTAIKENPIYEGDGYNADKVKIYFMDGSSTNYRLLTDEEVDEYFSNITVSNNNIWTLEFCCDAPCGMYKVVPYHTYHMDLSTANSEKIKLYNYDTGEVIESDNDSNIFEWTIPYSTPFYIENVPNDDSYIMEFEVNNDQSTPVIVEDENNAEGSQNRYAYIVESSDNQEVIYNGYEEVRTGENRVDKFVISVFVGKTEQESNIRIKAPYRATLSKWTGTGSPIAEDGTITDTSWESVLYDESETTNEDYKQYTFDVDYNEFAEDGSTYTGTSSVTYYKVTAEDGKTETVYTVNVIPGVRNKKTTLEIANSTDELSDVIKDELTDDFETSAEIYQEIIEKYGQLSVTIKELKGETVDTYQTKWFDGTEGSNTKPSVYNLKSYEYDVSIDLPAGYTYDVIILSEEKDGYQTLKDSINGFDGKRLVLSSPDAQNLNIRIVLKRDVSSTIWGVQYIWNPCLAKLDENSYTQMQGGGVYDNYVYSITSN